MPKRGPLKLDQLEAALSLSRKAFRLGKFLSNVKKCQKLLAKASQGSGQGAGKRKVESGGHSAERSAAAALVPAHLDDEDSSLMLALSLIFNCSEGLYYFLDQMQFLVKAKVVKKSETVKQIKRISVYAEITSYIAGQ